MNDFDRLLATEFGLKPQGKSAPILSSSFKGSSNFTKTSSLNFDSHSRSFHSSNHDSDSFSDLFNSNPISRSTSGFASTSVNSPVYDKPLYDDDDGSAAAFDDLLGGFGNNKPSRQRPTPDIGSSSESTFSESKTTSNATEDPFKIFESASAPNDSSSGHFSDPLEDISNFTSSRSTKNDGLSNSNGTVYDDTDPFDGLGNSVPAFSSERTGRNGTNSPTPRSNTSSSWTRDKESIKKLSVRSPHRRTHNKIPAEHDQEFHQAPYGMPKYSSDSNKPVVGQMPTSPSYVNDGFRPINSRADMSPKYEENLASDHDDIWLTVSEIPLFTQPTSAPPPSRPPPPRPVHIPKSEERGRSDHEQQQKETEDIEQRRIERERKEKERERQRLERERENERQAVERATREARERAAADARQRAEKAAVEKANAEARLRAERAAVQRAQAEARERAAAEAKKRSEKAAAGEKGREARERAAAARTEAEARVKAERAAVERAAAEARERAAAAARMYQQKNENDLESFFSVRGRANSAPRPPRSNSSDSVFDVKFQSDVNQKPTTVSSNIKRAPSSPNIVDDLSSIFRASPSAGEFQEVEGESEERRKARLERLQRAQERAAKALAEKNQRDLRTQREQDERHRLAETLDFEVKRWAAGKEGNLRALLSTLQYILWPECGWQAVSLTDLITAATVKKAYRKATLCIHPDKVQQKGATLQQKYIAEKVFDLLKEAWNKFNSEELF